MAGPRRRADRDIEDWAAFPDEERADVLWGLSSFFVGEERVTTQFFSRFYDTVFSIGGGMDAQLQEVRAELNDAFVELFDGHLVDACNRLVADPADRNDCTITANGRSSLRETAAR